MGSREMGPARSGKGGGTGLCAVFRCEFAVSTSGRRGWDLTFGVLCDVHGGIGGAEEPVFGGAVLGVEGDADACRAMEDVVLDGKGLVATAFPAGAEDRHRGADWSGRG